jgi:hypothetical protein
MSNKKLSISKQIVSITEISKILNFSRARFYQLLEQGFFPKPLYDDRSKRPYYDLALQHKCIESRQSGIGVDGSFMLFYSLRRKENDSEMKRKKVDPVVKELTDTLQTMGIDISTKQVQQGLIEIYPDGINDQEQGLVVRELFRYFKE